LPHKKKEPIPEIIVPVNATEQEMIAALKRDFTAADLQKFTDLGPWIPAEKLMAELETIQMTEPKKRQKS
jgi:hypothetical protein